MFNPFVDEVRILRPHSAKDIYKQTQTVTQRDSQAKSSMGLTVKLFNAVYFKGVNGKWPALHPLV